MSDPPSGEDITIPYPNAMDEWKMARSVFTTFDGYIHDLRKLGFAVLAALFTVDALQKLSPIPGAATSGVIDERMRMGLITITTAYIIVLFFLEHNYRQYMYATSLRANILERILNIELSETITGRYRQRHLDVWILFIYAGFVIMAWFIGWIIITDKMIFYFTSVITLLGLIILCAIQFLPDLSVHMYHDVSHYVDGFAEKYDKGYRKYSGVKEGRSGNMGESYEVPSEDWIIDKMTCRQGETVTISVTSLDDGKPVYFFPGEPPFVIQKDGEENPFDGTGKPGIGLSPGESPDIMDLIQEIVQKDASIQNEILNKKKKPREFPALVRKLAGNIIIELDNELPGKLDAPSEKLITKLTNEIAVEITEFYQNIPSGSPIADKWKTFQNSRQHHVSKLASFFEEKLSSGDRGAFLEKCDPESSSLISKTGNPGAIIDPLVAVFAKNLAREWIERILFDVRQQYLLAHGGRDCLRPEQVNRLTLAPYQNYSWKWDTTDFEPGVVYRVWPRGWKESLRRSIYLQKPAGKTGGGVPLCFVRAV